MNKRVMSLAVAGVMAVSAFSLSTMGTVSAADATKSNGVAIDIKSDAPAQTNTNTVQLTNRENNQSMVLSMREVAGIFLAKYPNSAIHSISLQPAKGRFYYEVVGYTVKNTYKLQIDVITSKIIKETVERKEKDIPNRIFNPLNVMDPKKAESIAVAKIGQDALSKGWILSTENGETTYVVAVYRNGEKVDITLNAMTGEITSVSDPVPMIISDDGADAEVSDEDTWFVPQMFR
ncbi:MAG: PepSY domain-containing protein [Veillonella sp.]|uniref:PepSY domain-containing protein n=1 Tax=Veillonella sp. TaxID=1926307 RepID=UPI0025FAC79B|nr:PepSY domain-containing protein [Veillonella sp.]MBS4913529.1 PepSY domain-containing protein [Veillonella sp.]